MTLIFNSPGGKPLRKRAQPEHVMQVALFKWAAVKAHEFPELRLMFAIPNGGARNAAVAARLKAEGVRAGVPDIFLPAPRGRFHGLWLELKAGKNKPSVVQNDWLLALELQGYRVEVIRDDWLLAARVLESYLTESP